MYRNTIPCSHLGLWLRAPKRSILLHPGQLVQLLCSLLLKTSHSRITRIHGCRASVNVPSPSRGSVSQKRTSVHFRVGAKLAASEHCSNYFASCTRALPLLLPSGGHRHRRWEFVCWSRCTRPGAHAFPFCRADVLRSGRSTLLHSRSYARLGRRCSFTKNLFGQIFRFMLAGTLKGLKYASIHLVQQQQQQRHSDVDGSDVKRFLLQKLYRTFSTAVQIMPSKGKASLKTLATSATRREKKWDAYAHRNPPVHYEPLIPTELLMARLHTWRGTFEETLTDPRIQQANKHSKMSRWCFGFAALFLLCTNQNYLQSLLERCVLFHNLAVAN